MNVWGTKMNKLLSSAALAATIALGLSAFSTSASAATCATAGIGGGDVSGYVSGSVDCEVGGSNNDNVGGGNGNAANFDVNVDDIFGGSEKNWILAEKWQFGDDGGSSDDVRMSVGFKVYGNSKYGKWAITEAPDDYEFMIVQKGGNGGDQPNYVAFLLDKLSGVYESVFHKNGKVQSISHLSVYKRQSDDGGTGGTIPLPAGFILLGTGLIGFGVAKRKKRNS